MCEYFSCIVLRNKKVLWDKNTISHEDLIEQYNLKDNKLNNRDFIRIEIIPKDILTVTKNKEDWIFKIDEEKTLPRWFIKNKEIYEKKCWEAWEESIKIQLAVNEKKNFKNCIGFAYGNSEIEAYNNSTVKAFDNSTVEAYEDSTVKAYENSTVKAYNNSTVETYNNSTVEAYNNSTVETYNNSTVKAFDNSTVKAYYNSTVEAFGSSIIIEENFF